MAHSLFDKEQYADSIFYYSKVIEDNPSVADNYYFRGSAWAMKENYDLSITDFSQAIELDNYHLKAYVNRGRVWKIKGELEKALKDFNKALELQPSDLNTLEERAEIFCVTGNLNKSINDLTLLINKKHNLSNSYRQRGDARGQIFDYDGAIKDFLKSIEFNPKNTDAYNNLAWLQATCLDERYRDGYKSVYNAKKANKLLPNNPPILDTLAAAYAETGDFKSSIKLLQKAINLVNENFKEYLKPLKEHLTSYKQNKPWRE